MRPGLRHVVAITLVGALSAASCARQHTVPPMGSAKIVSDFTSYTIRRVGFVPFRPLHGEGVAAHEVDTIETSFHTEFAAATPYDIVPLQSADLAEILPAEPFRRGAYPPAAILALRDRYRLDAILMGSVTARRLTPPLVLGARLDLVSCETGQTLWTSSILVDASHEDTRAALDVWAARELGEEHGAEIALLSPRKFAHFAAFQMSRML